MATIRKKVARTDIIEVKVDQLQEDVVEIRKDIRKISHRLDDMDESMNHKLDKILAVVTDQHTSLNRRVSQLEHHTTHPPISLTV